MCRREDEAAGPGAPPTKTIVFSTFTRALDLLEQRLRPGNIGFLRLDGRMRLSQRTDAIRAFARDPQVRGSCPLSFGAGCTVRQQ